ncbi:MAG: hypothetical protein O7G13_13835 [Alphaproteobacteria bacterium]|nr:hypothetical protein [Alphaproteobacteria bacterium]MCZ6589556.1 hypothetical protein [Alphaproteobacteria bacterium]MCZ6840344.1 hypothetical protein [Alphaproteobacteria bacterium]
MLEILSAKLYIGQHGDQAAIRSDAIVEVFDMDSAATWRKIIKAIKMLQAAEPGKSLH